MSDLQLRRLERRVLLGDRAALPALRRARKRAGRGLPRAAWWRDLDSWGGGCRGLGDGRGCGDGVDDGDGWGGGDGGGDDGDGWGDGFGYGWIRGNGDGSGWGGEWGDGEVPGV